MSIYESVPGPHFFKKSWKNYNGKIPFVVSDLIKRLLFLNCENHDGLFRLSAQKSVVDSLCKELDKGNYKKIEEITDIDVLASALKKFFSEHSLFDPLIEMEGYMIMPHIFNAEYSFEIRIEKLKKILVQFEPSSRNTLSYLSKFLNYIASFSVNNRMDIYNLVVCFSPALYPNSIGSLHEAARKALSFMFENYTQVFEQDWYDEKNFMSEMNQI